MGCFLVSLLSATPKGEIDKAITSVETHILLYALLIMFSGRTRHFIVQLAVHIAIQRVCEEYDSCREAKLLFLSSDVLSLRWHGQSVILSRIPFAQQQNVPTNSYAICTLLNLIYLRPCGEESRHPSEDHTHPF